MRHLALTGGIGSGKSTVAELFAAHGATIIDADAISRSLMEPGQQVLADVVATFGDNLLDESGRLNRRPADIVFNDDDARNRLNALVHPAVREESKLQLKAAMEADPDNAVIIQDIPLLVETGQAEKFDGVIVVYTQMDTRMQRLVDARGMNTDDARARIAAQATDEQRNAIADWIIDNSGSLENTAAQVAEVWDELRNASTV